MALYINFTNDDVLTNEANKVTAGFFDGTGTIAGSTLTTSSLSTTQKNYYYNLQYNDKDHISVTYGHIGGSGSDSVTDLKGQTEAIYKQFANYLLNPIAVGSGDTFQPSVDDGFQFTSGTLEHDVYIVSFERARFKDRVNRKTWTLSLSGSERNPTGVEPTVIESSGSTIHLTDDSKTATGVQTIVGPRYTVYSGSEGVVNNTTTKYGHFYPNLGLVVLSQNKLSSSLPGNSVANKSGSGYVGGGFGLAADRTIGTSADNAWKMARAIMLGSNHTFRNEEDQTTVSYFCRAKAPHFNFSNNPTFTSGSDGELTNTTFEGNPQSFITTVGLYDNTEALVAVGRLSKPIKKNYSSEAVIKVNLTY